MDEGYYATLHACSDALGNSNGILHASLTSLQTALEDVPRLQRILVSDRCYELVSDDEIRAAQLEIQREVEPQIKELISRAEEGLEGLQRRERTLNEARRKSEPAEEKEVSLSTMDVAKARARLMALQTQKETLMKATERIEGDIQSKQAQME